MSPALHRSALEVLRSWDPGPDPQQSSLRERFVRHLEAHPDATSRSCFPAHLTAGVVVLDADLCHVLLNLHRKARRWFAFGGHCEPGDPDLRAAALREGLEESGLTGLRMSPGPVHLDVHPVEFCDPRGTVEHLDVRYAAVAPPESGHRTSEESLDVRWFPVTGLPDGIDPDMEVLVAAARSSLQSTPSSLSGRETSAASDQPSR